MNANNSLRNLLLGIASFVLIAGCTTPSAPVESGFLQNYSMLTERPAPGGGTRLVYLNPDFTPERYHAVWLAPVVYYPEPQPSENVSLETLTQIREAVDRSLRQKIGQEVQLADRPGPGVAQVRIAITAVGTATQPLKNYQYIPIALVMTGARAAMEGGMPANATVAIESQITDSRSGELLYASVRGGTGERVASAMQGQGGVQLSKLQPLIDEWTTAAAYEIRKYVRPR